MLFIIEHFSQNWRVSHWKFVIVILKFGNWSKNVIGDQKPFKPLHGRESIIVVITSRRTVVRVNKYSVDDYVCLSRSPKTTRLAKRDLCARYKRLFLLFQIGRGCANVSSAGSVWSRGRNNRWTVTSAVGRCCPNFSAFATRSAKTCRRPWERR